MAEIDWSLAPKISGSDYLGPLHAMELGRQAKAADLQDQARKTALAQYTQGDSAGAQKTAVSAGDFDLATHLGQVDDQHRQQLTAVYDTALRTAYSLKSLPPEQRQAAYDAQAPRLQALGVPPQVIAQQRQHLDDAGLDSVAQQSMSILDQIKQHEEMTKPIPVAENTDLVGRNADGSVRQLYSNAPRDKIIPLNGTGGGYIVQHADGSYQQGGQAPQGPTPQAGDLVTRMLPITVKSESGGNPNAVSAKGAQGTMQVMPGTNADPGFGVRPAADASEAERARVGRDYLAQMVQRYSNPAQAWAAYNAGPGRVDAAIQSGGQNWLQQLPRETRAYVARNMSQLGQGAAQSPSRPAIEVVPGAGKSQQTRMTPAEVAAEGLNPKTVYYRDEHGVPQAVSGQEKKQAAQLTEAQGKAVSYLNTMVEATNALNTVKGYKPNEVSLALDNLSNGNPLRRELSQTDRRVLNAQQAFAGAALRLESGAVITPQEIARKAQTLFPLPGDGPEVQADKRRQREAALRGMRAVSGSGSDTVKPAIPAGGGSAHPADIQAILKKYGQ